ncbi:hypothetical protein [Actinoplanes couchii]|uniref:Uncharacterized protein n=1 Tax=Actinoplanes couchii TaxID=403638 RepID=A0ABQ3XFW1_9ACTN|nr:hypothetical protein [Actinoplanes couchii]MDR6321680.1 hypothetical protein [Actinoplanes couchii]GID57364.1 hypothetical protein Aco03nite_057680 [Actinoplanes couchii]
MTITRRRTSALATLVVVALAAGAAGYWSSRTEPVLDPAVAAALGDRVTPLIEKAQAEFLPDGQREACGVRVLGTEPPVTTAAGATTAYVWAHCATLGSEVRSESVTPVRVLLGPAGKVEPAQPWDYSDGSISTMFPDRLHDVFLTGDRPDGLEEALAARIRQVS